MASPAILSGQRFEAGVDSSASQLINITAHASANTKGSYVDVIAATLFAASGILIHANNASGSSDFLLDLAIGSAGNEQIIWANIIFCRSSQTRVQYAYVPLSIPAGVRLSARCQATTGGAIMTFGVTLIAASALSPAALNNVTTYGAATGDSGGASIDPGAVAHTKGAYTEISSGIANPIKWLVVGIGNQANTARTGALWLVDIAIGAAAAEQVVVPNLPLFANSAVDCMEPGLVCLPCDIPAGTRVAVRAQCSITDATDRLFDIVLYGVG